MKKEIEIKVFWIVFIVLFVFVCVSIGNADEPKPPEYLYMEINGYNSSHGQITSAHISKTLNHPWKRHDELNVFNNIIFRLTRLENDSDFSTNIQAGDFLLIVRQAGGSHVFDADFDYSSTCESWQDYARDFIVKPICFKAELLTIKKRDKKTSYRIQYYKNNEFIASEEVTE